MAAFCTSMAAVRKTPAVSLRAERSNLGSWGKGDCFAPLAMTQGGHDEGGHDEGGHDDKGGMMKGGMMKGGMMTREA